MHHVGQTGTELIWTVYGWHGARAYGLDFSLGTARQDKTEFANVLVRPGGPMGLVKLSRFAGLENCKGISLASAIADMSSRTREVVVATVLDVSNIVLWPEWAPHYDSS